MVHDDDDVMQGNVRGRGRARGVMDLHGWQTKATIMMIIAKQHQSRAKQHTQQPAEQANLAGGTGSGESSWTRLGDGAARWRPLQREHVTPVLHGVMSGSYI